jgi:hypothetical protein
VGRKYTTDTTNVYRQKVTREGVHPKNGWGYSKGDAYTEVEFFGPYLTRNVGGDPWHHPGDKTTVEIQTLGVVAGELQWVTEKMKVIGGDDDVHTDS